MLNDFKNILNFDCLKNLVILSALLLQSCHDLMLPIL